MSFGNSGSHYDVLELTPDASPHDIRESYLRLKSAFSRGGAALYTLMDEGNSEEMLTHIEDAYRVLSDPAKRKEYDRNHGWSTPTPETLDSNVISIDRFPPMDTSTDEQLLVPPKTDFEQEDGVRQTMAAPPKPLSAKRSASHTIEMKPDMIRKIADESEWRGSFLRQIREDLQITIEEMSDFTRLNKTYLRAIEDEDFSKLPAPVYLRGFLMQIAKKLNLPHDKVATAYVARYRETKGRGP